VLTQVLQIRRFLDQAINLALGPQLLSRPEILSGELLLDSRQDLQRTRVLHLLGILLVVLRGSDAGAVARATDDTGHLVAGCVEVCGVAHDGLAAFAWVVWFEGGGVAVIEAPGEEGVVYELFLALATHLSSKQPTDKQRFRVSKNKETYSFKDRHNTLLITPQYPHNMLTRCPVATFDVTNFHGIRQHAREAERHALRVLLAMHRHLEAVSKINVDDLAGNPVQHQVTRVAIAETQNIPDHGHDGKRARVVGTAIEPRLRTLGFEPKDTVEILACGVVEGVAEDFDFLHEGEAVVVGSHLKHDAVLDVEQDLSAIPILADEHVQSVAVRDEAEQARLRTKRDCGIAFNVEMALARFHVIRKKSVAKTEQLHDTLVLTNIFMTLEDVDPCFSVTTTHLQFPRSLLGLDD
jgi:hypothetical protein